MMSRMAPRIVSGPKPSMTSWLSLSKDAMSTMSELLSMLAGAGVVDEHLADLLVSNGSTDDACQVIDADLGIGQFLGDVAIAVEHAVDTDDTKRLQCLRQLGMDEC